MFKIKKIDNKDVYYSDIIKAQHFFTSRDLIAKDNLEKIANYLNIPSANLIKPSQIHSSNIEILKEEKREYKDCDALILNKKNYAIYLNFADCTPVILYDEKNNTGAVIHAGWRGSADRIVYKTVQKMINELNSNPKNITAAIGPCICFECFETYDEALSKLKNSVKNKEGLFKDNFADLKGINKAQLEEIGVENIDICPYCTVCNNDKFFSYRKENKTKNRHSAFLKLID